MRNYGNRTIRVNKNDLIAKIKENKENHIKEYKEAVVAYKEEALKQLAKLTEDANNGKMNLKLDLIVPIDSTENYDKIIEMFDWEVDDIVELDQSEFREYIQDETEFARQAKFANMSYSG
jgi:protein-tyrosine-phosphatase